MTAAGKWERFCSAWLAVGSVAVVDANRRISANGHHATMKLMALTGGRL